STPQGNLSAVSQFKSRTPWLAPPGRMNSATPTIIAIPASETTASSRPKTYSEISGTATHEVAAITKTMRTDSSPTDIGPSLAHSLRMSSAPPGMCFVSGLNITFVRMNQAPTISTMDKGTPTTIQRPKPRFISWVDAICAASNAFGGVPIIVPREPIDAEYAIASINAVPKFVLETSETSS